jgi:hypothetical protein
VLRYSRLTEPVQRLTTGWTSQVQCPAVQNFCFLHTSSAAHLASCTVLMGGEGVKRPGNKTYHSSPSWRGVWHICLYSFHYGSMITAWTERFLWWYCLKWLLNVVIAWWESPCSLQPCCKGLHTEQENLLRAIWCFGRDVPQTQPVQCREEKNKKNFAINRWLDDALAVLYQAYPPETLKNVAS